MTVLGNIENLVRDNIRILSLPKNKLAKPLAIIMVGLPGSGKTTLVEKLTKLLPLVILSDEAMAHFLLPHKATFFKHSQKEFLLLATKTMEELVAQGYSCIYDSNVKSREDRDVIRALVQSKGGRTILVYLKIPLSEAFKRVEQQNLAISRGEKKGFILNKDLFYYEASTTELPSNEEEKLIYDSLDRDSFFTLKEQIDTKVSR